jgi:hypothetical protein
MSDLVIAKFMDIAKRRRDIISIPQDHYMSKGYASKATKKSSHSQSVA